MTIPVRFDTRGRFIDAGDEITFLGCDFPALVVRVPDHPENVADHSQGNLHVEGHGLLVEVKGPITIWNR